jgi:hypothetical protein
MPSSFRAEMWFEDERWHARIDGPGHPRAVSAATRESCVATLRRLTGRGATLVIEVTPDVVGVAEAAAIMGWDKRRVVTYLDRGSFPKPFAHLASSRIWRRADVEAFSRAWHARHDMREADKR